MAALMTTVALLLALAQTPPLMMWTDASGVVHVDSASNAPKNAQPLEGDGLSVIDADDRPLVLADGGTRANDSAMWRARFAELRSEVSRLTQLEGAAAREVQQASQSICVTAKATAKVAIPVRRFSGSRGAVAVRRWPTQTIEQTETSTKCVQGDATSQRAALANIRVQLSTAESSLRALEREAVAAHVPLRDM